MDPVEQASRMAGHARDGGDAYHGKKGPGTTPMDVRPRGMQTGTQEEGFRCGDAGEDDQSPECSGVDEVDCNFVDAAKRDTGDAYTPTEWAMPVPPTLPFVRAATTLTVSAL